VHLGEYNTQSVSAVFKQHENLDYRSIAIKAAAQFRRLVSEIDPNRPAEVETLQGKQYLSLNGNTYPSSSQCVRENKKHLR